MKLWISPVAKTNSFLPISMINSTNPRFSVTQLRLFNKQRLSNFLMEFSMVLSISYNSNKAEETLINQADFKMSNNVKNGRYGFFDIRTRMFSEQNSIKAEELYRSKQTFK